MTRGEMAQVLGAAYLTYPNLTLTPEAVDAWMMFFGHSDAREFAGAFVAAMREPGRRFFPTPGEVNGAIQALRASETPGTTAGEAWALVRDASCSSGRPSFQGAMERVRAVPYAFEALRQVGGIDRIAMADHEREMPFIQRDFLRFYEAMVERDQDRRSLGLPPVVGDPPLRIASSNGEVLLLANIGKRV